MDKKKNFLLNLEIKIVFLTFIYLFYLYRSGVIAFGQTIPLHAQKTLQTRQTNEPTTLGQHFDIY